MMKKKLTSSDKVLLFLILFFISGYILFPVFNLINVSIRDNNGNINFGSYFDLMSPVLLKASFNSILLSAVTVLGSGITGVYFAYIFQYKKLPFKSFFSSVLLIPVATPPLIGVVSFLFLLSDKGLLTGLLSSAFKLENPLFRFDGWTAIIIIHIYSFYPMFFLFASSALKKIDSSLIDASYSLGAGRSLTFRRIIFPLLLPSVIGASLITFMASMASFSAPFIFGGSERFLTTEIYYSKINGDNSVASSMSVLLTFFSLMFLLLLRWYRSGKILNIRHKNVPKSSLSFHKNKISITGTAAAFLFSAVILLPALALIYLSLIPEGSLMRNFFGESFTAGNYARIFNEPEFFDPFFNSLKMSLIAVLITLLIGVSSSFLIARKKIRFGSLIENIISLPYGIPGTVIALSFILSFNSPTIFSGFGSLVGTFWIIPMAYAVRNIPIMTQSAVSGLNAFDPSLEEASKSLGASGFKTFGRIILPFIFPSLLNGSLLVFINSVGEFVTTILLYSYSTKTISVEIYSQIRMYNTGAAASYGVILFAVVMLVIYLSRKTLDKSVGIS